jgi:uncharacterized protein (TIGR02265 family)
MMVAGQTGSRIRGHVLLSRIKYVRDVAGEAGFGKVMAVLSADDQAILTGMVPLVSWYPIELNLRLDAAIAAVLSPRDRNRVFLELGRASAEKNLQGIHRTYLRQGDPHYLLSAAPLIYAAYYAVGRRTYEKAGDRAAVLRTLDAENVTAADCLTVVGWHQRAIEMCGGRDVEVVETQCRARGAPHCEYRCEWR